MKNYLFNIKNRMKSRRFPFLMIAWHWLILKKALRSGFYLLSPYQVDEALKTSIDVMIPAAPKDADLLDQVIEGIRTSIQHTIKNIYVIAPDDLRIRSICARNNCVHVTETSILGYGTEKVRGWIFQQLLKYGASKIVTEKYFLVIDADTVLLNPHIFIKKEKLVFFQSGEWHQPYFNNFKKLFGLRATSLVSHISHMMFFETESLNKMKQEIEKVHNMPWDEAIIKMLDEKESESFSEYETYSNWMIRTYPRKVTELPFYNTGLTRQHIARYPELRKTYGKSYNSVSFHSYLSEPIQKP